MSDKSIERKGNFKDEPMSYRDQLIAAREALIDRGITRLAVKGEPSSAGKHVAPVLADSVELVVDGEVALDRISKNEAKAAIIPIATRNDGQIPIKEGETTTVVEAIDQDPRDLQIIATVTGSTKDNTNPVTLAVVAPAK